MTTHVVCLDGTGQTRTQANPTNISLIFNAIGGAIVDAENNSFEFTLIYNGVSVQVGKYLAGVGTGSIGLFDLIQQVDGEGIAEPIVRGYTSFLATMSPAMISLPSASSRRGSRPLLGGIRSGARPTEFLPIIIRKTRRAPICAASPLGTNIGRVSPI